MRELVILPAISIEAEECGQVIGLLREQREVLEARFIELQQAHMAAVKSDMSTSSAVQDCEVKSTVSSSAGERQPSSQTTARRMVPQIRAFGALSRPTTPSTATATVAMMGTPRRTALHGAELAVKRLEKELELEWKRREAAERELQRIRYLNDRSKFTKKIASSSPRVIGVSPRGPSVIQRRLIPTEGVGAMPQKLQQVGRDEKENGISQRDLRTLREFADRLNFLADKLPQ
jgi:hypothetical protein